MGRWFFLILVLGLLETYSPIAQRQGGIAAQFPGDIGIKAHPDVIFADDFEAYGQTTDLRRNWDTVHHMDHIRLVAEPDKVFGSRQALEFKVPQRETELANAIQKTLVEKRDRLYLRYYSKFEAPYDVVGSSHNGSMISGGYFVDGMATPGVPADGSNKFLVNLEHWRGRALIAPPGELNIYIYHPEQRSQWGDHFLPSGRVLPFSARRFDFGPTFVSRPDIVPNLDQWYCYELMVQLNTPGERDGRITAWLDGVMVADFGNLRLRDVESLEIDRFGLSFHIGSNRNGESRKWVDNVVAATSYIGPLRSP